MLDMYYRSGTELHFRNHCKVLGFFLPANGRPLGIVAGLDIQSSPEDLRRFYAILLYKIVHISVR